MDNYPSGNTEIYPEEPENNKRKEIHELKIWPEYFDDVLSGRKPFEVRKMDRLFGVGDHLWLREWSLIKGYSGRETYKEITYVMHGGQWGLSEDNCILGIATPPPAPIEGEDVKSFLDVLVENYQAQIAGFYNDDKTDAERAKRNAVIEEYKDLIAIFKRLNDII